MMRLQTYAGFSFLAAITAVYHAFNSRGQFYSAMVYLSTSKICFVLLVNMGLVMMCMLWQLVKRIFLGPLREAEVERLNEQAWREVMEILFAITIFRQDFSVTFVAMVTALLLIKALHWLAQKRVEYIETTPTVPLLSHIRIVSFMVFLLVVDCLLMYSSLRSLIETSQASVDLFFAFEYTILASTTISTFIKYVFYVTDMLMEGQWEKKATYTFYLELLRDLFHLSLYICFFLVIFRHYGIPLHLIRELYETFRSFRIRVADYIRYRKITSNMNERFPDATPEELNASDATCIICREEMVTAKKLLCGHLFHVHCLRSWLERQHTCPTCRALVVPPENGPAGSNRQHATPSDRNAGSSGAGTSSQGSGSNVAGDYLSQQQARIKAAAVAASLYEKSYFYPPTNTFFGSPRPSPQVNAANHDADSSLVKESSRAAATSAPLEHQQPLFLNMYPHAPVVLRTPMSFLAPESIITSTRGNEELQISLLKAQQSLIQSQIEILQSQLKASQQPKGDESSVGREDANPAANGKGKAIASSSASGSDCGRHGEIEDADTEWDQRLRF